jgi:hypothetical protein
MLHTIHLAKNIGCHKKESGLDDDITSSNACNNAGVSLERKPISSWDLNDVRAWLLAASKAIAKHWLEHGFNIQESKSLEELEGVLVQHVFVICEHLETNMEYYCSQGPTSSPVPLAAGKKLLLMSSKKLSSIVGDAKAASALHQKLRGVVNRQAARRHLAAGKKASHVRFQQIKRKHWVEAKQGQVAKK